jgi:hypothetical protein
VKRNFGQVFVAEVCIICNSDSILVKWKLNNETIPVRERFSDRLSRYLYYYKAGTLYKSEDDRSSAPRCLGRIMYVASVFLLYTEIKILPPGGTKLIPL